MFLHRPVLVGANEDAVAIAVETEGHAEAAEQAVEQAKIATRVLGGNEFRDQDFAGGVVQEAEQGKLRPAIFQPAMQTGIEQHHFAFASAWQSALAMGGSAAFAGEAIPAERRMRRRVSRASEKPSFSTNFSHR